MTTNTPTTSSKPAGPSSARSGSAGSDHDSGDDVGSEAAERFVRSHPWLVDVARVGWAAKGVVYLLTGVLAFAVAAAPFREGNSNEEADPSGAISKIAEQPFGTVLLWTMAVGLLVYAVWRLVTVILPAGTGGHAVLRRVGYVVSAATYVALAVTAVSLARHTGSSGGGQSQDSRVSKLTADVLAWSGGRLLVGLAGLVVIGVGVYFFWKGVTASFAKELEHRSVGPISWKAVRSMGRAGWIGRGTMTALIGVFVTRAAIRFDPDEAGGLDDSLRRVADSSIGMVLVYVVAIGLLLYGAHCVVSTPIQKLVATDDDTVA
jgi:hypothetical protein